jgi:hypothetical protein
MCVVQKIPNPVPRVAHPDWLSKQVAAASDSRKQQCLTNMFQTTKRGAITPENAVDKQGTGSDIDLEDMDMFIDPNAAASKQAAKRRKLATLYRVWLCFGPCLSQ